mmetsp:Transcript_41067/g.108521  ORF Transcript_41067/g.108521 Transcript_41067/m.108521 type:complete len:209 (+) Transcript_41067:151-777(+)
MCAFDTTVDTAGAVITIFSYRPRPHRSGRASRAVGASHAVIRDSNRPPLRCALLLARSPSATRHKRTTSSKDGDEGKARVEESDWICKQPAAVVGIERRDEEQRRCVRAPEHRRRDAQRACKATQVNGDGERCEEHDRQQRVADHGRSAIDVDALRRHQVEHSPDAEPAGDKDAIDGTKLHLAFEEEQRAEHKAEEQGPREIVVVAHR